jgi:hypothetical protein
VPRSRHCSGVWSGSRKRAGRRRGLRWSRRGDPRLPALGTGSPRRDRRARLAGTRCGARSVCDPQRGEAPAPGHGARLRGSGTAGRVHGRDVLQLEARPAMSLVAAHAAHTEQVSASFSLGTTIGLLSTALFLSGRRARSAKSSNRVGTIGQLSEIGVTVRRAASPGRGLRAPWPTSFSGTPGPSVTVITACHGPDLLHMSPYTTALVTTWPLREWIVRLLDHYPLHVLAFRRRRAWPTCIARRRLRCIAVIERRRSARVGYDRPPLLGTAAASLDRQFRRKSGSRES